MKTRRAAAAAAGTQRALSAWAAASAAAALLLLLAAPLLAAAEAADGLEELFMDSVGAESARANLKHLTSVPHQAGSPGDYAMAKVSAVWPKWGIKT